MTPEMLPWIVARAAGLAAYACMAGALLAGLLIRTRTPLAGVKGADMVAVHRQLSLLALAGTAVHGIALVLDPVVDIPLPALVVPGLVPYRPLWSALGVVAGLLALTVHVSFALRKRIGAAAWRRIHFTTYAAFALATAHGVGAGTDAGRPWVLALYGGAVGGVAALTGWRAVAARRAPRPKMRQDPTQTAGAAEREAVRA